MIFFDGEAFDADLPTRHSSDAGSLRAQVAVALGAEEQQVHLFLDGVEVGDEEPILDNRVFYCLVGAGSLQYESFANSMKGAGLPSHTPPGFAAEPTSICRRVQPLSDDIHEPLVAEADDPVADARAAPDDHGQGQAQGQGGAALPASPVGRLGGDHRHLDGSDHQDVTWRAIVSRSAVYCGVTPRVAAILAAEHENEDSNKGSFSSFTDESTTGTSRQFKEDDKMSQYTSFSDLCEARVDSFPVAQHYKKGASTPPTSKLRLRPLCLCEHLKAILRCLRWLPTRFQVSG